MTNPMDAREAPPFSTAPAAPANPNTSGAAPAPASWRASFRRESLSADWGFIRRVLIVILLVGLAYFLWSISRVLVLVFAAILIAVLLDALANILARHTPISRRWSLTVAVLLVLVATVAFLSLFGAQVQGQVQQLFQQLPDAIDAIGQRFGVSNAADRVGEAIDIAASGNVLSRIAGIGFTIVGVLADLFVVVVAAIYLASSPDVYRRGAIKLFPISQHQKVAEALDATSVALRYWAAGQLVTMAVIGILAGLAYWIIGLPSPLALALVAAITNFIPFIGPLLGAIPALIFALTMNVSTVIWTLLAITAIQQLEGNVVTPLIQRRAVSLPPALGLFAIVVFGLLFGFLGIFLAVPLTVALMVLVKKLWIRETLGEETTLPGEGTAGQVETDGAIADRA